MNTQYERNSTFLAGANYRMRRRERELRFKLAVFLTSLSGVCAMLYAIILKVS